MERKGGVRTKIKPALDYTQKSTTKSIEIEETFVKRTLRSSGGLEFNIQYEPVPEVGKKRRRGRPARVKPGFSLLRKHSMTNSPHRFVSNSREQ